jgi:hypothetical protein
MELSRDEERILEVVETPEAALEPAPESTAPTNSVGSNDGDEASETLARLYTELLGLLPQELPPVTPRPEIRQRILAAIQAGEANEETPPAGAGAAAPAVTAEPLATVLPWPAKPPPASSAPARPARWPLALAATLALALLGSGAFFYSLWSRQNQEIGRLRGELVAAAGRLKAAERAQVDTTVALARLRQLEQQIGIVSSPDVARAKLLPLEGSGLTGASGNLYVMADHQHWYLAVHGLKVPEAGKHYRLWFVDDKGQPYDAGVLHASSNAPSELVDAKMPAGAQTAVVTLEPDPGFPTPQGPPVLKATPLQTL